MQMKPGEGRSPLATCIAIFGGDGSKVCHHLAHNHILYRLTISCLALSFDLGWSPKSGIVEIAAGIEFHVATILLPHCLLLTTSQGIDNTLKHETFARCSCDLAWVFAAISSRSKSVRRLP